MGLPVPVKNQMKRLLRSLDIPRQRNVRGLEPEIHRRLVGFQKLENDIVALDFQLVQDLPAGIFLADAGYIHLEPVEIVYVIPVEIRLGDHNDARLRVDDFGTILWIYAAGEDV